MALPLESDFHGMVMNALENLVNNVPDWLRRLDNLSGQIDRRQAELAAEEKSAVTKPLRNKGSTESLKPKDDPPSVHVEAATNEDTLEDAAPENKIRTPINAETLQEDGSDTDTLVNSDEVPVVSASSHKDVKLHHAIERTVSTSVEIEVPEIHPSDPGDINNRINTATERHLQGEYEDDEERRGPKLAKVEDAPPSHAEVECEYAAAKSKGQTPVNAEDHKGHRTSSGPSRQKRKAIKAAQAKSPSMLSNGDAPAACRKRNMIIVYYDSYVQSFFYDLARSVSSSQNLLRKAKKAARIAWIKKLAEQDVSEDGNNDDALPSLRYMGSRRFGPMSTSPFGATGQPPVLYDKLVTSLEFVQNTCEHGAHQFLRDGDCNDEISKVQKRLTELLEMAKTEKERVEREEPELAKKTGEMGKDSKLEAMDHMRPIEVDPKYVDANIMEADKGIDVEVELPKLQYRSTRAMRSRGP
ncbi:hypothetical protein FBULB1_4698 [Fusarium bulbicola]|nr:hypothetical protein FBULB1_4698 [Fusarium bulbicola]